MGGEGGAEGGEVRWGGGQGRGEEGEEGMGIEEESVRVEGVGAGVGDLFPSSRWRWWVGCR